MITLPTCRSRSAPRGVPKTPRSWRITPFVALFVATGLSSAAISRAIGEGLRKGAGLRRAGLRRCAGFWRHSRCRVCYSAQHLGCQWRAPAGVFFFSLVQPAPPAFRFSCPASGLPPALPSLVGRIFWIDSLSSTGIDCLMVARFAPQSSTSKSCAVWQGLAPPDGRTGLSEHAASVAGWPSLRGEPDSTVRVTLPTPRFTLEGCCILTEVIGTLAARATALVLAAITFGSVDGGLQFEVVDTCVMYPLPPGAANCTAYSEQLRGELEVGSAACRAATPSTAASSNADIEAAGDEGGLAIKGPLRVQLPVASFGRVVGCAASL